MAVKFLASYSWGKSLYCLTCLFQGSDPFSPWRVRSNSDNVESHDLICFHFSTLSRVPCATSYCHIHSTLVLDEFSIHVLAPLWGQGLPFPRPADFSAHSDWGSASSTECAG